MKPVIVLQMTWWERIRIWYWMKRGNVHAAQAVILEFVERALMETQDK